MIKYTGAIILLLLFLSLGLGAQSRLHFNHITEDDGLVDNRISCFLQDREGYMWIGTQNGISRYDGRVFETFKEQPESATGLKSNKVFRIAEDKKGKIWIATNMAGVNCYDPATKRFSYLQRQAGNKNSLVTNCINEVFVDSKNRVWIGYWGSGWTVYDQQTKQYEHFVSGAADTNAYGQNMNNTIDGFAEMANGDLWIVSNRGIHHQSAHSGTITSHYDSNHGNNPVADNLFTSCYKENDSVLWLGTWGAGLKKFNTQTKTFTQFLWQPVNPIYSIFDIVLDIRPKSPDELWIASADKSIGIFHIKEARFEFFAHKNDDPGSPLPRECRSLWVDREGTLWAGFDFGISRCNKQSQLFEFRTLSNPSKEYRPGPTSFYKDPATGLLYAGGNGCLGLHIINEGKGTEEIIAMPDKQNFVTGNVPIFGIIRHNASSLLISSHGGLYLYHLGTKKIEHLSISDQNKVAIPGGGSLTKDAAGYYWFDHVYNGVFRVSPDLKHAVCYYRGAQSPVMFRDNHLTLLLMEGDTTAWIYELGSGLYQLKIKENKLTKVVFRNHVDTAMVYKSMKRLAHGRYMVSGFNFGVQQLTRNSDGTFYCNWYRTDEGIYADDVQDMCFDADDRLWAATDKGPALLLNNRLFKTFRPNDGYIWEQGNAAIYGASDGFVYVHAIEGYVRIDARKMRQVANEAPVTLQSLKVFDKEWSDTTDLATLHTIELPYNQNFISATFAAISFLNPVATRYAYKLDGLDEDWIQAGNRNYLSYAALAPGSYRLHIKATTNSGEWNNQELVLSIIIHPPFWKTWWFILLIMLAFVGGLLLLYAKRLMAVRKEAALKNEFDKKIAESEMKALRAQMNPHFVFNSLNSINRYIVKSDPATASNYLTKFSKLIRYILDSSAAGTTTLESEMQLLKLYIEMESLRFEDKFTYEIEADEDLDQISTKLPSMIIQPFIENAIWHGLLHKEEPGHLKIFFRKNDVLLRVTIEDNGVGRERSAAMKSKNALRQKSYGMQISSDRIRIANALYGIETTLKIEDLKNEQGEPSGTRITLEMPLI